MSTDEKISEKDKEAVALSDEHLKEPVELTSVTVTQAGEPRGRRKLPPIEELLYYADAQRESYKVGDHREKSGAFEKVMHWADERTKETPDGAHVIKSVEEDETLTEREKEWLEARRGLRTAGWVAMFYLITTDILGPFNAPYAFSTIGYAGGVLLYFVFGVAAGYTSYLLLYLYLRLDSDRYPVRNYADIAEICLGPTARKVVSTMQTLQLIIVVATCQLGNGQALFQITQSKLCFIVNIVIFCILGMFMGQLRSLKSVAWIGSASVYLNVLVIFLTMGFVAHSAPNYVAANAAYGYPIDPPAPIQATATVTGPLANQVNGAMNMVYAWGGMMIFPEMMAEMRRPMDFWKAIMLAECVIMLIYVTFGIVIYSLQGQYVLPLAYQGVSVYAWQSIGNGITMFTVSIAATLLSNIGCKVIYEMLVVDVLKGPPLISRTGRIIWTGMVVVYWGVAFFIATAIPQVQTLQGLIGAAFLMQFSYTFPPAMQFAFDVIVDATKGDPPYVPGQPHQRADSWKDASRWRRGLLTGHVWFKWSNLLLAIAGLATAGLGMYGSILTIIATFATGAATSFGCAAPV